MPVGLMVMKWDERSGTEVIIKYPEEINIKEKVLMQLISTHEYSGEAGSVSLMVGSLNIASYYTGPESSFYILLLLTLDEDPDAYEGGMADIARFILKAYAEGAHKEIIPSAFHRISMYPKLTETQLLALIYHDELKRMIIKRLRDEGVVSKSELMVWLKDTYKKATIDIDALLFDLIKREIVKEASVKGMPSELIFLSNDLLIMRVPPIQLLKNSSEKGLPSNLIKDYRNSITNFFENYRPSEEDNMNIIETIVNKDAYEVLRLLKTGIVSKNDLEKLRKKGVDDIDSALKLLWDNKLIQIYKDNEGIEHYALIADFNVSLVFPKYLLSIVKKEYEDKSKPNQVLIQYLNVLEETYLSSRSKAKSEVK